VRPRVTAYSLSLLQSLSYFLHIRGTTEVQMVWQMSTSKLQSMTS